MKQLIYKISFLVLGVVMLSSCEANDIPTIGEDAPTLVQFGTTSLVMGTPEEGTSREVEVIVTNTSETERTVDVTVDPKSTATEDQYEISNLVIPANSYTGTFTITSNYEALPESGSSELILNLNGVGGEETLVDNGTLEVEMFRKCPVVIENFVGTWTGVDNAGYETTAEIALNDNGELTINGLGFGWMTGYWGEVIITNDPVVMTVDPETETISIEEQFYMTTTWNGAPQPLYNLLGEGEVLNACENKIFIGFDFNQPGGAGILGRFEVVLQKQ